MSIRLILILTVMLSGALAESRTGMSSYPDPTMPLISGLLRYPILQVTDQQAGQDTAAPVSLSSHPDYKYPGRTMLMSLILPGSGQLVVNQPVKAAVFIGVDILALWGNQRYTRLGETQTQTFKDSVDFWWDFKRWIWNASQYPEDWNVGLSGSHHLQFFVDADGDERPDQGFIGSTTDDADTLNSLLTNPATRDYIEPIRSQEYYENIGKYNQFFSGWDDADPTNLDTVKTESGLIAYTPHRRSYLQMRFDANRLRSVANYAISALMFNHVLSALDAIFATSRWNRNLATDVSARLLFDPRQPMGIGGLQLSVRW